MLIYAGSINRDHVHMLIGIPPQLSVPRAVQYMKGKNSHKLLSEYGGDCANRTGDSTCGLEGIGWQRAEM